MLLSTGTCNSPPGVNPWRDDSIPPVTWTTPSEQGILASGRAPAIRQRDMAPSTAPYVSEEVPHFPLWWEDPFEDKGDQDGQFAWTWQDYLAMPYSYARSHLNTLGWPVSAVVDPPGKAMVSDGRIGPCRPHDAQPGYSPNPAADEHDFTAHHAETPGEHATQSVPATAPAGEVDP